MWRELRVADLEVLLEAETPVRLPFFKENALRAGLNEAFRRTVCATPARADCDGCLIEHLCAHTIVFSPDSKSRPREEARRGFLQGLEEAPRPYSAFFRDNTPALIQPGERFTAHIRLFGHGVAYYPYFFLCLEKLAGLGLGLRQASGRRGRFRLRELRENLPGGRQVTVLTEDTAARPRAVQGFSLAEYVDDPPVSRLSLVTLSPLRLKFNHRLDSSLQFHIILRNALRRISSLYLLATGSALQLNYRDLLARAQDVRLVEASTRWEEFSRYSSRQQRHMYLGGVTGRAVYEGDLTWFYPFLKAAEVLGIGKGTTFGFGRYVVMGEEGEATGAGNHCHGRPIA